MSSIGASSSSAMSYLQQLMNHGSTAAKKAASETDPLSALMQSASGDNDSSGQTASVSAQTGSIVPQFGTDTMSALLSAQDGTDPTSKLFAKLDTDSDGKISKTEFDTATQKAGIDSAKADAAFGAIDANGDGAVSTDELALADHHVIDREGKPDGSGAASAALQDLNAAGDATTTTTTNADGSTTTSITYADGSKIQLTAPAPTSTDAAASSDGSADSSTGGKDKTAEALMAQLTKIQSQLATLATSTLSALI